MKLCIALISFFLFIASCQSQPDVPSQEGAESTTKASSVSVRLTDASIGDASTLIPMLASDVSSHSIASLLINGLIKYDKDLNIVGDLAKSWEVSEDGLSITFHLRKGVKWEDGVEFNAHDIEFGFNLITDPKTPTAYSGDYLEVKTFELIDDYSFKVTYKRPFAPALGTWGNLVVLPKHLIEGKYLLKTEYARHPIGLGPYRFKEWKTGRHIVIEASDTSFDGKPAINTYLYRIIPDQSTMFLELKSGGIDLMTLTPPQYRRQTNTPFFKKNFNKYQYTASQYTYLGYNLEREPFNDKRVRQALSYGINKQEIIDGVLLGLGSVASVPYVPNTWAYNEKVKKYPYNPEKAKELLAEAGWKDTDGNGILDKDGKEFHFTVLTNQGNSLRAKTAAIIQRRLKDIGVQMDIRIVEWAAFLKEFVHPGNFDAVILGWTISQDPDQFDIWHSSKTGPSELNFIHYNNPEVDKLLLEGRQTFDKAKRKKIYDRFQEIIAEEQPLTFLYVPDALPIVQKRFKGIEPGAAGIMYNFEKWYVEKPAITR